MTGGADSGGDEGAGGAGGVGALRAAAERVRARLPWTPEVFAVLGSGLGSVADALEDAVEIPLEEVFDAGAVGGADRTEHDVELPPAEPASTGPTPAGSLRIEALPGHDRRLLAGTLEGRRVLLQAGRFHLYEGHPIATVVLPVRIAALLGVPVFIVTNASGGVNPRLSAGALMLIEDHLNLMGRNPLVGPVVDGEPRFPDMSAVWDPELRSLARRVADEFGIPVESGVYAAVLGPSFETPAEVRMIGALGGDAVGMSTVPEAIVAQARGMRVLGISLVANAAAGLTPEPLSHEEVLEAGRAAGPRFERLFRGIVERV